MLLKSAKPDGASSGADIIVLASIVDAYLSDFDREIKNREETITLRINPSRRSLSWRCSGPHGSHLCGD